MGKITRRGGVSRASVQKFEAPALRKTPRRDPRRDARLETFAGEAPPGPLPEVTEENAGELREHPGTGEPMEAVEAQPDGSETELDEPAPAKATQKRGRKATGRGKAG